MKLHSFKLLSRSSGAEIQCCTDVTFHYTMLYKEIDNTFLHKKNSCIQQSD